MVVGRGAYQAVRRRDWAGDAGRAVAPRHCPGVHRPAVVPVGAAHHIVAFAQHRHQVRADPVVGGAAHQAVGRRDDAAEAGRAVHPRHRPGVGRSAIVPGGAAHHIVAFAQHRHAMRTDLVIGGGAGQGADQRPGGAVVQVHRPHVGGRPGVIGGVGHHDVAVGQRRHRCAKPAAAGRAGDVPLRRGGRRPGGPQRQGQHRGRHDHRPQRPPDRSG